MISRNDIQIRNVTDDLKKIFCDIVFLNNAEQYKKFNNFTYRTLYWSEVFGEIFKRKRFSFHPKTFLEKYRNRLETIEEKFSPEIIDENYFKWSDQFFKYYCNHVTKQNFDDPVEYQTAFFNHVIKVLNKNSCARYINEYKYLKTCIDVFIKFYTKWFFFDNHENGKNLIESVILYSELSEYSYGTVLTNWSGEVVSVLVSDHYTENFIGKDKLVLRVMLCNQLLVDIHISKLMNKLYKMVKKEISIGEEVSFEKIVLGNKKICQDYHHACPVYNVYNWENLVTG